MIFRNRISDLELDRKGQKRLRNIRDFLFTHSFFSTSQKKDTDPFSPKGKLHFVVKQKVHFSGFFTLKVNIILEMSQ